MGDTNLWRDRNKVFVAGIPTHVDDNGLYEKFKPFGEMHQSKVVYDNRTGKSKGFGFVTFCDYLHALEAVEKLNQSKWDKRTLNVRFLNPKTGSAGAPAAAAGGLTPGASLGAAAATAPRQTKIIGPRPEGCTTVYVGNLAYDITEEVLRKVFDKCGSIRAVRFAEHIQTKEFRGFGYVQFHEEPACEQAIKLDGMIVMGRPMNIDYGSRDENTAKAREDLQKKLKKGICNKFQTGQCDRGDDCKFAHILKDQDAEELIQPADRPVGVTYTEEAPPATNASFDAPVCINFQKGKCKRGSACNFQHLGAAAASHSKDAGDVEQETEAAPAPVAAEPVVEETSADADAPVCQNYQKNKCKRGAACRFRHVLVPQEPEEYQPRAAPVRVVRPTDVVPEVAVCQNYKRGRCTRGASCRFAHTGHVAAAVAQPVEEEVSFYQKRFQSICYNWQNARSCIRGDKCPFQHEGADTEAPAVSNKKSLKQEETEPADTVEEEEATKEKKHKEKKVKKSKKRKSADSDSESEVKKKKKHKQKKSD